MNKSFTVIIPTYNSEKYIEKCINSLINQNYDQSLIQILVIDDGSTDNTAKIVKEKYHDVFNVEYHKKENGQWGSVINYAKNQKLVKNDYVSVLDADDYLDHNAYQIINSKVGDSDIFVGSYRKWDGTKMRKKITPYWFIFQRTFKNKQRMNSPYCLPLIYFVKKEIFYQTRDLMEGVPYQDPDLISQFILHAKKMKFTRKTIGYYYFNRAGNSISQAWSKKRFDAELNACLRSIENDAQEIVSYRLNLKNFKALCEEQNIGFDINRKMKFSWYPWYLRIFYCLIHQIKFAKFFQLKNKK